MKNWSKGARPRSHDLYFSNFGTHNISGTVEGTNLKFSTWIEGKGPDGVTLGGN